MDQMEQAKFPVESFYSMGIDAICPIRVLTSLLDGQSLRALSNVMHSEQSLK
jgi:hypothetical protein